MARCYVAIILWAVLFSLSVNAMQEVRNHSYSTEETVISGVVRNNNGQPLGAVMIRVSFAGKDGPYVLTDKNGAYSLKINSEDNELRLRFSKIGFETESRIIDNATQHLDITMSKSAATLKEVIVKAPDIHVQGDTVTYLLSSFVGKGDISLKDALKKMPGIEVAESGEISYNGKKISNFYIEGMDLLGGKYDIATTNIPASYVNAVEVLNNHQEIKIDRRIFNDNVALNIKLKPHAKFRPMGNYSLSAGYGDKPLPLAASGAGMMFYDDFQSILTLKGSDIEEFSNREIATFYGIGDDKLPDLTADVLGNLSASNPPLSRNRWIRPIDASTGINFINKVREDISVRTNIGYSFLKTEYDYSDTRLYFDGISDIIIQEFSRPETRKHTPFFSVEYLINNDNRYFTNNLSGNASFYNDVLPLETKSDKISQRQEMNNFSLRDILNWGWKKGKTRWNYHSTIEYISSPKGKIGVIDNIRNNTHFIQTGRSYSFLINEAISGVWEIKRSRIFFPISFNYINNKLHTHLFYSGTEANVNGANNRINGSTFKFRVSPEYYYASRYNRFVLRIVCQFGLDNLDIWNKGTTPIRNRSTHLFLDPSFYFIYKISAKSSIWLRSSYKQKSGELLDFVTAPVMTDYISASYKSGILSKVNVFTTTLHYDFKLPISMWYANADLTYIGTKSNLMSVQDVNSDLITVTDFQLPHSTGIFSTQAQVIKNIRNLNTKLSFKASFDRSSNEILQNDMLVKYHGGGIHLTGEIFSRPLDWFELNYRVLFSTVTSRYLGHKQSFTSQTHDASISFYPITPLQIKIKTDITRHEIEVKRYKTNSLFDAYIAYKFNKFRLSLTLRNLLNRKSYSYSIFSGLDKFTYDYNLRGRQLIAHFEFNL